MTAAIHSVRTVLETSVGLYKELARSAATLFLRRP